MYRYKYQTYGSSKVAQALPKVLDYAQDYGSALGGAIGFAAKGLYDTFSGKNKMLDTNTMPYRPKRPAFGRRRSSRRYKKKQYKSTTVRRKSRRTYPRKKTNLRREVKKIKKQLDADSARHVSKAIWKEVLSCSTNAVNYLDWTICTASQIESFLANLRYYDPGNPGTLTTASGATGSYSRDFYFKNIHSTLEVVNNYQIPCRIKIYLVKPKGDTGIVPTTYYSNCIADQVITGGSVTTKGVFPTDLTVFMSQWNCKCVKDVYLDAGARVYAKHNTGPFRYDPSVYDSQNLEFQSKFKACNWLIRIEGVIAHDSVVATQVSTAQARVDVSSITRAEIIYDAGVVLDDIYISNTHDGAFTNAGFVTNKPIADNQPWSNN